MQILAEKSKNPQPVNICQFANLAGRAGKFSREISSRKSLSN
jgi:hypothetical protein